MADIFDSKIVDTTVQRGSPYEKSSITVTYRVWRKDSATGAQTSGIFLPYGLQDVEQQLSPPITPDIGTAYPANSGTYAETWQQYTRCRSLSARPMGQFIDVTAVFDTMYFYATGVKKNIGGTVSDAPDQPYLPARLTISTSTKEINVWRVNWSTAPSKTVNTTGDVGGTAVVSGITPIKIQVPTSVLKLKFIIDAETTNLTTASQFISTFAGKRNSDTFLGYPAGELVCTSGGVSQLEHEFFEVQMDYTWDAYYEHVQVPEMAADGRPKGGAAGATTVKWQRPDRTSTPFNDIWLSGDVGGVQRYMAEEGTFYA